MTMRKRSQLRTVPVFLYVYNSPLSRCWLFQTPGSYWETILPDHRWRYFRGCLAVLSIECAPCNEQFQPRKMITDCTRHHVLYLVFNALLEAVRLSEREFHWLRQWHPQHEAIPAGQQLLHPESEQWLVVHLPSSPSDPSWELFEKIEKRFQLLISIAHGNGLNTNGSPGFLRIPTTRTALISAGIVHSS